jgi:hypothetical protein
MTTDHPEPEQPDVDDLGLTYDDWHDIMMDYYFSNTDPPEGSVKAEAFQRLDAFTRRDTERAYNAREKDEAYHRCWGNPFPGGPLTSGLTSRETAELSDKLYSAHVKAYGAWREADWRKGDDRQFHELDRDIWDVYRDVNAEAIVSGIRAPGEIRKEFTQRVALEEPWIPNPRVLERPGPEPELDLEAEPW